jgi:hypothetical protein
MGKKLMEIKCILINIDNVLITQIEEVPSELGEPDCKLINPYRFLGENKMKPWLGEAQVTNQTEFMIHSDKILTIFDPTPEVIEEYKKLIEE